MPGRRGTRSALRRAADTVNRNPPAPAPEPRWLVNMLDWLGRTGDILELEATLRYLERLIRFVRERIRVLEARPAEPEASRPRR